MSRAVIASKSAGIPTYLSTDDEQIALDGLSAGAVIVKRPSSLATDSSSSEEAIIHALQTEIENFDYLVFIQPTSPFIDPKDIENAFEIALNRKASCVFSAVEDWSFKWSEDEGNWSPIGHPLDKRPRRQDLGTQVRETGAFYILKVEDFLRIQSRFCGVSKPYLVDSRFAIDIDTFQDLEVAEALESLWVQTLKDDPDPRELPFSSIKAIAYDFDGVMTPNTAIISEDGSELTTVHRGDGHGVRLLREAGIRQAIFSLDESPLALQRAKKLKIEGLNRVEDKLLAVREWAGNHKLDLSEVAYIGNDLNDLEAIRGVGLGVAVADAHPRVLKAAKYLLGAQGGSGAIREFAEMLLKERKKD